MKMAMRNNGVVMRMRFIEGSGEKLTLEVDRTKASVTRAYVAFEELVTSRA